MARCVIREPYQGGGCHLSTNIFSFQVLIERDKTGTDMEDADESQ